MASALKLGGEVLVHNLTSHLLVDKATRHHQHVGIVVLTDEVGNLRNPAEASADALMLVQRHVDALAASADGNAGIHFTLPLRTQFGLQRYAFSQTNALHA